MDPLGGQQSIEERPVPGERHAKIFGGGIVAGIPLGLQTLAFVREAGSKPLHEVGHERVCLLDRFTRSIDESGLNLAPAGR
jgi:hypothetical protein